MRETTITKVHDFPYMIMCIFNDARIQQTKISKTTAHITLKRRFRLINKTEKQLIDKLTAIHWLPIQIQTKEIEKFSKSGIEYIATSPNPEIEILQKKVSITLHPFTETRDPHKEIGYDKEHANAHISLNQLNIKPSDALNIFGNSTLQIKEFLLVKDTNEDSLEILTKL